MNSGRKTNKQKGWVNFPTDSKEYVSTQEGGIYVQLWVTDWNKGFPGICIGPGTSITAFKTGTLIGTDTKYNNDTEGKDGQQFLLEKQLFPNIEGLTCNDDTEQYLSIRLLACIDIGSTGWSGYSEKKDRMWRCTFRDLKKEARNTLISLQNLYGKKSKYHIVTWLDT